MKVLNLKRTTSNANGAYLKRTALFFLTVLLMAGCSKKDANQQLNEADAAQQKNVSSKLKPNTVPTTFKTMAYNIHLGVSPGIGTVDLQWIADVINNRSPKPDLVALSEVDVFTNRSGPTINQAAVLAQKTGMYFAFFRAEYYDGGEYGNAILSKYPIREYYRYVLPAGDGEPRCMGMIEVMVDGKPFNFAVTHLDHTVPDANRLLQVAKINEMVAGFRYPVILGGDFNAKPTSAPVINLEQQLTLGCNGGCPLTCSAANPSVSIDHFFYKSTGFNRFDYYTVTTQASDHLPLIATWTLK